MKRLSEQTLRRLIKGGETTTVELKIAAPRAVDLAERFCGMANAQGGSVIIGVEDSKQKIVGVPDERMAMTIDTILRAARQNTKPPLISILLSRKSMSLMESRSLLPLYPRILDRCTNQVAFSG